MRTHVRTRTRRHPSASVSMLMTGDKGKLCDNIHTPSRYRRRDLSSSSASGRSIHISCKGSKKKCWVHVKLLIQLIY